MEPVSGFFRQYFSTCDPAQIVPAYHRPTWQYLNMQEQWDRDPITQLRDEVHEARASYVSRMDQYTAIAQAAHDIEVNADGTLAMARVRKAEQEALQAFDKYGDLLKRFADAMKEKYERGKPH